MCTHGMAVHMPCPFGTAFDVRSRSCVHVAEVSGCVPKPRRATQKLVRKSAKTPEQRKKNGGHRHKSQVRVSPPTAAAAAAATAAAAAAAAAAVGEVEEVSSRQAVREDASEAGVDDGALTRNSSVADL